MTATNKCYNFVGFRCRLPLNRLVRGSSVLSEKQTRKHITKDSEDEVQARASYLGLYFELRLSKDSRHISSSWGVNSSRSNKRVSEKAVM